MKKYNWPIRVFFAILIILLEVLEIFVYIGSRVHLVALILVFVVFFAIIDFIEKKEDNNK
jgi:uncharacterized membrane protein YphA (DoxX/SURF4 family)